MKLEQNKTDKSKIDGYLTGKLLVANPFLQDANFAHSVIYVCGHDAQGAIGLIINKPLVDLSVKGLFAQLGIESPFELEGAIVNYGGPSEMNRGFVLHSVDYKTDTTVAIDEHFSITSTLEILRAIALEKGPDNFCICLGYIGWGAGQLDQEIQENGWIAVDASSDLVFDPILETKWRDSFAAIGVDPSVLSFEIGHA
ncbi:MAG: YqgE/AlgH family protein [Alphaproteobacteria bacterium]|nr:YqgE/AlgH family protein [Alphaproteobacteria bacterium]